MIINSNQKFRPWVTEQALLWSISKRWVKFSLSLVIEKHLAFVPRIHSMFMEVTVFFITYCNMYLENRELMVWFGLYGMMKEITLHDCHLIEQQIGEG